MPKSYSWRKYKRRGPDSVTNIVFIVRVMIIVYVVRVTHIIYVASVTIIIQANTAQNCNASNWILTLIMLMQISAVFYLMRNLDNNSQPMARN